MFPEVVPMLDVLLVGAGAVIACAYAVRVSRRARIHRVDAAATVPVTVDGRELGLHAALWALAGHGGAEQVGRVLLESDATTAQDLWAEAVAAVEAREPREVQASTRHRSLDRQATVERAVWRAHTRLVRSATTAGVVERAVVTLDAEPEWVQQILADLDPAVVDTVDTRTLLGLVEQLLGAQLASVPETDALTDALADSVAGAADGLSLTSVITSAHAAAARLGDSLPADDWAGIAYPMRDVLAGFRTERAHLAAALAQVTNPRYRRSLGQTALFLLCAVADADVTRRHADLDTWESDVERLRREAAPAELGAVLASRADLCRRLDVDYTLLDEVLDAFASVVERQAAVQPAA